MKCPNCEKEIMFVRRFLIYEVGDAYPITEDGNVNISDNSLCQTEGPTATEMNQYMPGSWEVWCECPECQTRIERADGTDYWDEEGKVEKVYTCSHCLRKLRESEHYITFCNGYDEDEPGYHVVSCVDCAGLLLDGMQNCEECRREDDEEDEDI